MVTAYDYPSAVACSSSPLTDITLVGDSLAQVCLGYASTTQLTMEEMVHHAKAVARGTTHPLLVADMPYGSYYTSVSDAVANAVRLVREGRMEGLKLEGGSEDTIIPDDDVDVDTKVGNIWDLKVRTSLRVLLSAQLTCRMFQVYRDPDATPAA